jgi:protein-tyrosine phosphatase
MNILFICSGNTCRSPLAKAIMAQKLKVAKINDRFEIDSAAYSFPTSSNATHEAREAIRIKYGEDLLASHRPKRITPALIQWADIILVMSGWMKEGLPLSKAFTLKEFPGGSGDISDPFGQGINTYLQIAYELSEAMDKIIPKLSEV